MSGRLGDRFGYRRVFLPCLVLIVVGLSCLTFGGSRFWLVTSAVFFGAGFGTAYPVFAGYVLRNIGPERRGAAFGAILACFDTGIGTGSTSMGWIIGRYGFAAAFGTAAALSALALPYFLLADTFAAEASAGWWTGQRQKRLNEPTAKHEGHEDTNAARSLIPDPRSQNPIFIPTSIFRAGRRRRRLHRRTATS